MFSSLGRKPEKDEENKGANDAGPLGESETNHYEVVTSPDDGRDLPDAVEVVVGIFPADPRRDGGSSRIDYHRENCKWGGAHDLRAGQRHEAEIPTSSEG